MAAYRLALIRKVRERTDLVGSTHITDSEIADWLAYSLAECYEKLVEAYEDYSVVYSTQTVTSATATGFALPDDFFKLLRVDKSFSGSVTANDWQLLRRCNIRDESTWNQALMLRAAASSRAYGYVLVDNYVRILPQNQVIGTYQLLYYPVWTTACLTDPGGGTFDESFDDTFSSVDPLVTIGPADQCWEEYAIVDTCIKACAKEETDASMFVAQKGAMLDRLAGIAANRNAGEAEPPPANDVPWYERGLTTWGSGFTTWWP